MSYKKNLKNLAVCTALSVFISGFFYNPAVTKADFYSNGIYKGIKAEPVDKKINEKKYVIPMGDSVGIKLFTEGLLVLNISPVYDQNKNKTFPAKDAGIMENDRIISADGIKINSNEEFAEYINRKKKNIKLSICRDGKLIDKVINPGISEDGVTYKAGIWVRDSSAGIGTLTYYDPESKIYAALGHPITDADIGSILKISEGRIMKCKIISVKKSENGCPGELCGCFTGEETGNIKVNNEFGIYGNFIKKEIDEKPLEVGSRFDVKQGDAEIICDVTGEGKEKYKIKVCNVSQKEKMDNKGIVIEVTDERLLQKTGGIVQGMSGSPIIQNNKLVGAVTHVFVNNPEKGYATFIENMINSVS